MAGLSYDDDEASEPDDNPDEESDEYAQAASEAFPDEDWTPERVEALRALIKMCMEPAAPAGKGKKGGALIELMFGHGGSKD